MTDNAPYITDAGTGIDLHIPVSDGIFITIYMDDDAAGQLCSIIRNKLNARF